MEKKKETWRDKYFWHGRWDRKTIWVHLNKLELWFEFVGFCFPALEATTSGHDHVLTVKLHLILFGITFGTSHFPFMSRDTDRSHRITGFYTSAEGISINFYLNEDGWSKGWRGWGTYKEWVEILKGRRTTSPFIPAETKYITLSTIPRDGYPDENVTLRVLKQHYTVQWSRWKNEKPVAAWQVNLFHSDYALRVPGKGENSWDQEDSFGLDLYIGDTLVKTAMQAATYAIKHIDESRSKY